MPEIRPAMDCGQVGRRMKWKKHIEFASLPLSLPRLANSIFAIS